MLLVYPDHTTDAGLRIFRPTIIEISKCHFSRMVDQICIVKSSYPRELALCPVVGDGYGVYSKGALKNIPHSLSDTDPD